jgi:Tfp pilus assembly protein PilO
MFSIFKIVFSFKVLVVLLFILLSRDLLAYDNSYLNYKDKISSNIPSDKEVTEVLKSVYKDKYRDSFEIKNFIRLNGHKKDYLYSVSYNITLVSKKDINLSQNYTDIVYFTRLLRLKNLNVLININKDENFFLRNEVIELIKSEKGWVQID